MSAAELTDAQIRQQLIPALHKLQGTGSLGDIVAAAGTPARKTAGLLNRLLVEWGGTLAVDERGELLYRFPPSLSPPYNWDEQWQAVLNAAYGVFKVAYKVCIAVVLVVYFLIFLVIMIALILAALAAMFKDSDSDGPSFSSGSSSGGSSSGGGWGNPFIWIIGDWGSSSQPARRSSNTSFKRSQGISGIQSEAPKRSPLWTAVFDYVFGPEPLPVDPAAADREILAFIREHKGVLTTADLVMMYGYSFDEAERRATRLLVDYSGEPEVSDNGSVIYRFAQVVRSAERDSAAVRGANAWHYWWEQQESPPVMDNNGTGTDVTITVFNCFNLAWSGFFCLPGSAAQVAQTLGMGAAPAGATVVLGTFPLLFSIVFFTVPAIRWTSVQKEKARVIRRNQQRELMKALAQPVMAGQAELPPVAAAKDLLTDAVVAWKGDAQIGPSGELKYRFERLQREVADAKAAQQAVKTADLHLGPIVYDTNKDLAEQ